MRTVRTSMVVAALAACLVIGLATPAFAEAPRAQAYVPWSEVATLPGQGSSPHGGYATTTVKCAVCHSVHNAGAMGDLLLQDTAAGACNYCHVNSAMTVYTQVYNGDLDNYQGTDYANAHNSFDNGLGTEQGVTCSSCHQVHGASYLMTYNAYLTTKILSVGLGPDYNTFPRPNWDPTARNALSTDDSSTALTKWCAGCHFTKASTAPYYNGDGSNSHSHIMTTATASTTAFKDSTYCFSCHSSDFGTSEWPHFTQGESFLQSAANSTSTPAGALDSREDGVCIRCHRTGSDGVGLTF